MHAPSSIGKDALPGGEGALGALAPRTTLGQGSWALGGRPARRPRGPCGAAPLSPVPVIGEVGVRVCVQPRRTRTPPPPSLCLGPLARAATGVALAARGRVATAVLALRSSSGASCRRAPTPVFGFDICTSTSTHALESFARRRAPAPGLGRPLAARDRAARGSTPRRATNRTREPE